MFDVMKSSWALMLGIMLLMTGNGMQATLLGLRGSSAGIDAAILSWVMSAYFLGYLGGSRMTPWLIGRVGHVRVFAALASIVSAAFVIYAVVPDPWVWMGLRVVVGFCYSGIYVVAESWLNASSTNENRGKSLSVYLIVQMIGIIGAQMLINIPDPSGYLLFIVMSVLVSVALAPMLLSVSVAPAFEASKSMPLRQIFRTSPLGFVGTILLGGVFAQMFGMSAIFAQAKDMSIAQTSFFVATMYVGGLICQYPIGHISDRVDRRALIVALTGFAALFLMIGSLITGHWYMLLALGFVLGGVSHPLYSALISHTNDFLDRSEMASVAGGMLFLNGMGAVLGPIIMGLLMSNFGADWYFRFIAFLFSAIALYGLYRMTIRPARAPDLTITGTGVLPHSSAVAVALAQEAAVDEAAAIEAKN